MLQDNGRASPSLVTEALLDIKAGNVKFDEKALISAASSIYTGEIVGVVTYFLNASLHCHSCHRYCKEFGPLSGRLDTERI